MPLGPRGSTSPSGKPGFRTVVRSPHMTSNVASQGYDPYVDVAVGTGQRKATDRNGNVFELTGSFRLGKMRHGKR